jgi:hypothetical protein
VTEGNEFGGIGLDGTAAWRENGEWFATRGVGRVPIIAFLFGGINRVFQEDAPKKRIQAPL